METKCSSSGFEPRPSYHAMYIMLGGARRYLAAATIHTNASGYQYVLAKENKRLFDYLEQCRFFAFHCTNVRKEIAYVHQIVLYTDRRPAAGWRRERRGEVCRAGLMEVHHLDGDPSNNDYSNLWYVSPIENKLLAHATQNPEVIADPAQWVVHYGTDSGDIRPLAQFTCLLELTLQRTMTRLGLDWAQEKVQRWWRGLPTDAARHLMAGLRSTIDPLLDIFRREVCVTL